MCVARHGAHIRSIGPSFETVQPIIPRQAPKDRTRFNADLHTHTTFSDGILSPTELVSQVHHAGVEVLAVTDHDTTGAVEEAAMACRERGIGFVRGVEISCSLLGAEVHLLGYGIDTGNEAMQAFLAGQEELRAGRAIQFLDSLMTAGALPAHTRLPELPAGGSYGRPHLADLLVAFGSATDRQDAFNRFLVPGTETFVPKRFPSATDAVKVVQAAGGLAVLAHPGHGTAHRVLLELVQSGLDGIEVVHPSHDPMLQKYYGEQARRFSLLMTGGSDFHGLVGHRPDTLGRYTIRLDVPALERLRTQW